MKRVHFVKVYNNVINRVNEIHIKDFVLNHVVEIDMNIYNFFKRSTTKFNEIFKPTRYKKLTMIRDTSDVSYFSSLKIK